MSEIESDMVQCAITSMDSPRFLIRITKERHIDSITIRSRLKEQCGIGSLFRPLYLAYNFRKNYEQNFKEIERVLKPDGVLIINVGIADIRADYDIFGSDMRVLYPYLLAEDIVTITNFRLRRDYIGMLKHAIDNVRIEHWFMFTKGESWKEKDVTVPAILYGETSRIVKYFQVESKKRRIQVLPFSEEIIKILIDKFSEENDWILDPYAGSGTLGLVGAKMNRNVILYEKNEFVVAIMKNRLEKLINF